MHYLPLVPLSGSLVGSRTRVSWLEKGAWTDVCPQSPRGFVARVRDPIRKPAHRLLYVYCVHLKFHGLKFFEVLSVWPREGGDFMQTAPQAFVRICYRKTNFDHSTPLRILTIKSICSLETQNTNNLVKVYEHLTVTVIIVIAIANVNFKFNSPCSQTAQTSLWQGTSFRK